MKLSTLAVALTAVLASTATLAATPSKTVAPATGRYLVVFKSDTVPSDAAALIAKAGGKLARSYNQVGVATATGNAKFVSAIAKDTRVLSVGPEGRFEAPDVTSKKLAKPGAVPTSLQGAPTPDDFLYYLQWDMRRIGADQVWSRLPVSAGQPRVALLDVGTMDTHPDLVGQIDASKSTAYCSTSGGTNNTDGYPIYSTYIDFSVYPNWTPGVDPCLPLGFDDFEFHGTHTAGTIGAAFGGGAVVGVAPDAQIGVYKVFDLYSPDGIHLALGAFDGPLFGAIIDATLNGYPVISMSLGGNGSRNDKAENASWLAWNRVANWATKHGTLLVAAAGNSALDLNGSVYNTPSDVPSIMNVSATGAGLLNDDGVNFDVVPGTDVLAFYSNYGSPVDIGAPGGDCGQDYLNGGGCDPVYLVLSDGIDEFGDAVYYWAAGTSMATPHVAAVAAYVRAIHPDWSPNQVRAWLKSTSQNVGSRQLFGAGLLDANAAAH